MGPAGLVPVVDVRDDRGAVGAAIDRACHEVGFFQIVGHDLDPEVESAACLGPGEAPTHPAITAGRHLMDKFLSTQS